MTLTVTLALVGLLVMVVGEAWRISPSDTLRDSPLTQATAVALVLATAWPVTEDAPNALIGLTGPLLLVVVAVLVVAVARRQPPDLTYLAMLLASTLLAGVLARVPSTGGITLVDAAAEGEGRPRIVALFMLLVAIEAMLLPFLLASVRRAVQTRTALRQQLAEDVARHGPLILVTATTAAVMAKALPVLEEATLVLFLVPLVVLQLAVGRQREIKAAQVQTVGALARLTDQAGLTAPGHGERVAALAVPVARDVGVDEQDLRDVEAAALLHDLGQVALTSRIPGGATIEISRRDQRGVAAAGAAILARTAQLSSLSAWVADAGVPHHRAMERGDVALPPRVIRVVSAYDDLTGHRTPLTGAVEPVQALDRLVRNTPHDYDPQVVLALIRQLERRGVISHRQAAELRG
ncbi:HD-GYP domain-containing protein [Ornithinimicrobium sufpigmenti]|uniref:HD-GYP domain-containing protein n=1 Tax=Ornithinimicrobium sufpigmenti TaxID=2508882 RepID=UPI001035CCED|nr:MULTISPECIES: HD domain-containing phosphohydrolase [unclassified Ornithinimicrobium]